jgi:hypothetical protein
MNTTGDITHPATNTAATATITPSGDDCGLAASRA